MNLQAMTVYPESSREKHRKSFTFAYRASEFLTEFGMTVAAAEECGENKSRPRYPDSSTRGFVSSLMPQQIQQTQNNSFGESGQLLRRFHSSLQEQMRDDCSVSKDCMMLPYEGATITFIIPLKMPCSLGSFHVTAAVPTLPRIAAVYNFSDGMRDDDSKC